jgi:proteic killer suppression protein
LPIQSFRCSETEAVFQGNPSRKLQAVRKVLERKLVVLDAAAVLSDLVAVPGNRLEKLVGNRAGQHSIRVNDQYRLCFVWTATGPKDVDCVDYH